MTTPTTVQVQIQLRADTAANWASENPTLLANEVGLETDTKKLKVGDGTTAWNTLAYFPSIVTGGTVLGNLEIGTTGTLTFEGSTANDFETTLAVTDPTADRTITLPDQSGTVVVTGNASIVDADIAANAEIAVSKLANGTVNQVLVTDGTDVSWSDDLTLAGNLTVNGTTTTVNTETLTVKDKNIELAVVDTPSDATADGGGITLKGATDKTITWSDTTDAWTSNQVVDLPAGTNALPALFFNGDVDTGIYSPGADQLAISTSGTQRVNFGTGGVVFNETGEDYDFRIEGDTEPNLVFVDASTNQVGLGTSDVNSNSKLHIAGGNSTNYLTLENTTAADGDGTRWSYIVFEGTQSGNEVSTLASINAEHDGSADDEKGRLVFKTNDGNDGASPGTRMTLTSTGLGIGTTSPADLLHSNGNIRVSWGANRVATVFDNSFRQGMAFDTTNRQLQIFSTTSDTGGSIGFYTRSTAGSSDTDYGTEKARIDVSGRLLVGTSTSPSAGLGQYARISAVGYTGSATGEGIMTIARGKAATSMVSGDTVGQLSFTDINGNDFAKIICSADATPGSGDYPGVLTFSTNPGSPATGPTERMSIDSAGIVYIRESDGTAGAYHQMDISANYRIGNHSGGSGNYVYLAPGGTSWVGVSDERLKTALVEIQDGLSKVSTLRAVTGRYTDDPETESRSFLIAQDVAAVLPEAVDAANSEQLGLRYTDTIPLLVAALKEAKEKIETLEAKVNTLEGN